MTWSRSPEGVQSSAARTALISPELQHQSGHGVTQICHCNDLLPNPRNDQRTVRIPGLMTLWQVHPMHLQDFTHSSGQQKIVKLSWALRPVSGRLNEVWRRLQALPVVLGSMANQAQAEEQEETERMVTSEDSTASSSRGSITLSCAKHRYLTNLIFTNCFRRWSCSNTQTFNKTEQGNIYIYIYINIFMYVLGTLQNHII